MPACSAPESIHALFRFLREHGAEPGVAAASLGLYAASANVSGAVAYLANDSAAPGIRAAALYYGGVPDSSARMDLPTLFIVAASDAPRMMSVLPGFWPRVLERGAPWTLQYASGLPHAFDAFSDNDEARRIVQQTPAFWKSHAAPVPQPGWKPAEARAIVAARYGNDAERSASLLTAWVASHPDDAVAHAQLGRVLGQLRRVEDSERAYLRARALDSTEPGVPIGLGQVRLAQPRWAEALGLLSRARAAGIENSMIVGQVGWAQLNLGRNAEAAASYERAFELGIPPGPRHPGARLVQPGLRLCPTRAGGPGVRGARQGHGAGAPGAGEYEQDPDLAPLRADPRFAALLRRLDTAPAGS